MKTKTKTPPESTVFLVDDDEAVRDSLQWLMRSIGLSCETFPSAQTFLDAYRDERPGCLILDIRMPGMSGLELQERLNRDGVLLPIIVITGHGDVPIAVRALKAGAVDFIQKPFNDQELLDRVQQAITLDRERRRKAGREANARSRLARLTPREQEVLDLVVAGASNKVMAERLGVSQKTIEAHRAKVMDKLEARSVSDLVRIAIEAGV